MHRSVSNALKRWGTSSSFDQSQAAAHLCKSCQNLAITQNLIKDISESRLPNGNVALEPSQVFLDLPIKRKDQSPDFPQLKAAAALGCEFCASLYEAIQWENAAPGNWRFNTTTSDVVIKFRYCYGPDLGLGSFEAGQWPTMLAALEAIIHRKDLSPIIIVFKIHCEPGKSETTLKSEV